MTEIIKLILAILGLIIIGYPVLYLILGREKGPLEGLSLSFGLGVGILSLGMFILSWLGFHLGRLTILIFFSPFLLAFLWLGRNRIVNLLKVKKIKSKIKNNLNLVEIILIFLILFSILTISFDALFLPMHTWDAKAIWGLKAKILCQDKTVNSNDFFDEERIHPHKDYPLLIPLTESYIFTALGEMDDRLVKIIFPLFFIALLLIIYSAQRRYFTRTHSILFTTILATIPVFMRIQGGSVASGYADVPLSFFYTTGVIFLYLWMKNNNNLRYIILAALFLAFAVFTKAEGQTMLFISSLVILVYILFSFKEKLKQRMRHLVLYLIVATLIILPWLIFRRKLPIEIDWFTYLTSGKIISNLSRIPVILKFLFKELINPKHWNVLWVLFGVVSLLNLKRIFKEPIIYLYLLLFLQLSVYLLSYLITPCDLMWHMKASLMRLLMHLAPLTVFLISNLLVDGKFLKSNNLIFLRR